MKSSEVRKLFLEFFRKKGHEVLPSDSLIPSSDPTLLFTSAGMVQFKNYFTGVQKGLKRVATSQKCFRTTDIEKIGHTPRHLSFFEMLGNFSFGDYFKEEAIIWAWEFLIETMGLSAKDIYVTIYKDDAKSGEIWKKIAPVEKIYKLGENTNFWNMGPTGPCGPCSEIIYDLGKEFGCGRKNCNPGCDCPRWLELWNLVFTQFDRSADGDITPLPEKNIDTGMGLERLVMVANSKKDVFETDLFESTIKSAAEILRVGEIKKEYLPNLKIIADHCRSILFLMSDGITVSNEGRGYVLRRIIRRAQRSGRIMGSERPFLYKIIPKVADTMSQSFPEIMTHIDNIGLLLKNEEEKFLETLDAGLKVLDDILESKNFLSGQDAFYLYETYGFPFDMTQELCGEKNIKVDEKGFAEVQREAKELSRASWKGASVQSAAIYENIKNETGKSLFSGYEKSELTAKIMATIKDGKVVEKLSENDEGEIILDNTPFYAESGGQMGDTGRIAKSNKEDRWLAVAEVDATQKPVEDIITHKVKVTKGEFRAGDEVTASIDIKRRKDIARHHTATHLLHKALREILGNSVVQSGSLVAWDYLRFDFSYPVALKPDEIFEAEKAVNDFVKRNLPVCVAEEDIENAKKKGAMALFGEKYGKKVRTVSVNNLNGETPVSIELCGGTHVKNTGELGFFKIVSESSIGSGTRRIHAVAGTAAENHVIRLERLLEEVSESMKASPEDLPRRIRKLILEYRELERELEKIRMTRASADISEKMKNTKDIKGVKFFADILYEYDEKMLPSLADSIMEKVKSGVVMLVNKQKERYSFIINVSRDLAKEPVTAKNMADAFARVSGASGGGKDNFARGGGKDGAKIENGIDAVKEFLSKNLA